jgi:hypothetical protein
VSDVKYVVQIKRTGRWAKTYWTRKGKSVSKSAVKKALARAEERFTEYEYRIKEVKE